jgi:hypothetical protein
LVRLRRASPDGAEIFSVAVQEADASGRLCRRVIFDDADLVAALEELDTRYREIAGNEYTVIDQNLADSRRALQRRDWERLEAMFSPDLIAVDHRSLGFPEADRTAFINERMRGVVELTRDHVLVTGKVQARGLCGIWTGSATGTTTEGNAYAWNFHQVMRCTPDGLCARIEFFSDDHWHDAVALLDEWADATPP